MVKDRKPEGC